LKNAPKAYLANLVEYVATREGVEKVSESSNLIPATKNQQQFISEILKMLPDTADLFEYEDYLKNPTRENASEFISIALENNLDLIGKKKNFVEYIANRPRVEKIGSHGLFTDEGVPVVLSRVAEEVSNHSGNVWTNIVSLRREDAPWCCGRCDTCWAGTAEERAADDASAPWSTGTTVRHPEFGEGTVMGYEGDDRVTVLFETHGYRTLSLDAVTDQGLLTAS